MQLIYRGQAFHYSPVNVPLAIVTDGLIRTLLYRGNTYECQMPTLRSTRLPNVINWRFAGVVEKQHPNLQPAH